MTSWFICENDKVRGPFSSDELKAMAANGTVTLDSLIWGRSQTEWIVINKWLKEVLPTAQDQNDVNTKQMWHYAVGGDSKGPMNRIELIAELKSLRTKDEVLLWTKGMKAWADLYEFHDILDELGMNKREHERAQISGQVIFKIGNVDHIGQLRTISSGGFGCNDLKTSLAIGQVVTLTIQSDQLNLKIMTKATVQYVSDSGFYGFKFNSISMESRTVIMEYIRREKINFASAA